MIFRNGKIELKRSGFGDIFGLIRKEGFKGASNGFDSEH